MAERQLGEYFAGLPYRLDLSPFGLAPGNVRDADIDQVLWLAEQHSLAMEQAGFPKAWWYVGFAFDAEVGKDPERTAVIVGAYNGIEAADKGLEFRPSDSVPLIYGPLPERLLPPEDWRGRVLSLVEVHEAFGTTSEREFTVLMEEMV